MKPFFSILTPTHNRPKRFHRCMKSIYKQTFNDYEVIINNDSNDVTIDGYDDRFDIQYNTYTNLADIYQSLFDRIRGEYIWVVEDDDYILHETTLSKIYDYITTNDVDLLLGSHYVANDHVIHEHGSEIVDNGILSHNTEDFQFGDMVFNSKYLDKLSFMSDRNHMYNDYYLFNQLNVLSPKSMSIRDVIYTLTYSDDNLTWKKETWDSSEYERSTRP